MNREQPSATDADIFLERVYEQHGTRLLRMAAVWLGDDHLAEDAVQETLLKLHRSYDSFDASRGERAWVMRIALNTCRDMQRARKRRESELHESMDALPGGAGDSPPDGEVVAQVRALPPKYREVVLLTYYQDLPGAEVAAALGISESAVRARLTRARRMLQKQLKGWWENDG